MRAPRNVFGFIWLLSYSASCLAQQQAEKESTKPGTTKLAIPSREAPQHAQELVTEVYANETKAVATSEQKVARSKEMLRQTEQANDDVAAKCVLMRSAAVAAVKGRDVDATSKTVDDLLLKVSMIPRVSDAAKGPPQREEIIRRGPRMIGTAVVGREDFQTAHDVVKSLKTIIRESRSREQSRSLARAFRELRARGKTYKTVEIAHDALRKNPNERDANRIK